MLNHVHDISHIVQHNLLVPPDCPRPRIEIRGGDLAFLWTIKPWLITLFYDTEMDEFTLEAYDEREKRTVETVDPISSKGIADTLGNYLERMR
jgi:hypothetical protein